MREQRPSISDLDSLAGGERVFAVSLGLEGDSL